MKKFFVVIPLILLAGCISTLQYMGNDCDKEKSFCKGMAYGAIRTYQALARANYAPKECIPQRANTDDVIRIYAGMLKKTTDERMVTSAGVLQAIIAYAMEIKDCSKDASLLPVDEAPITDCRGENSKFCKGVVIGVTDALYIMSKGPLKGCIPPTWRKRDMDKTIAKFKKNPSRDERVASYVTGLWLTNDICGLKEKFK